MFMELQLLSYEMDMVTRVQILEEAVCISHHTNTLGKAMNQTILPLTVALWDHKYNEGNTSHTDINKGVTLQDPKWICVTFLKVQSDSVVSFDKRIYNSQKHFTRVYEQEK